MNAKAVKTLFLAAGGFSFLVGLGWLAYGGLLKIRGRSADGIVVGEDEGTSADNDSVVAPVISFKTAEGRTIKFTSIMYSRNEDHALGQHVPVLYDPSAPKWAEIDSFKTLWLMPALFLGCGVACVAAGFGAAWTLRKTGDATR